MGIHYNFSKKKNKKCEIVFYEEKSDIIKFSLYNSWCSLSQQKTNPPFGKTILLIPFHSIFSPFSILQTIPLHSTFFNHFFQLSKFLYNIFKSQPFILPQNQQSQIIITSFLQIIFKPFKMVKNDQNDFPKHIVKFFMQHLDIWAKL